MVWSGSVCSRSRGLRLVTAAAVVVIAGALWGAAPAMAAAPAMTEEIQHCVDRGPGGGLTMGPGDGKVWFPDGDGLGRVDLDCTGYQHFPLPADIVRDTQTEPYGVGLWDIASGSDGNLWVTNWFNGRPFIGKMTPQGEFTEYPFGEFVAKRSEVPTTGVGMPLDITPYEIEAGPDGNIWFTAQDYVTNATLVGVPSYQRQSWIGRFSPEDPVGTLRTWSVTGMAAGIAVIDGDMWFTTIPRYVTQEAGGLARIDPDTEAFTFWPYPPNYDQGSKDNDAGHNAYATVTGPSFTSAMLTGGPDGNVWFTQERVAAIGRFSPGNGEFTFFSKGVRPGQWGAGEVEHVGGIASAHGNLYAQSFSGDIYKITTGGEISIIENPIPETGEPMYLIKMADGNLWTAAHAGGAASGVFGAGPGPVARLVFTAHNRLGDRGSDASAAASAASAAASGPTPKSCKVPNLKGLTTSKARQALSKAGCKLGKTTKKSKSGKKGRSTKQSPKAGTVVPAGTAVTLTLRK